MAVQLSPYNYKLLGNYGLALERTGNSNDAKRVLLEALRINPQYEPARLNMVILEYNRKHYKEALLWLSTIANYEVNYSGYLQKIKQKLALL